MAWASQLKALAGDVAVDWSDSWSDEDLRDLSSASMSLFESR
jgi:hypothetical protein